MSTYQHQLLSHPNSTNRSDTITVKFYFVILSSKFCIEQFVRFPYNGEGRPW